MLPFGTWLAMAWAGEVHAVLINGGSNPDENYQSHLGHLVAMRDVLIARGIPAANIDVFCSDGGDPEPDMAILEEGPDDWLVTATPAEALAWLELRDSRIEGVQLLPATRAALDRWFRTDGATLQRGDTLYLYATDHGTPEGLVLWDESLAPSQLNQMLDRLRPGVQVVSVMSQCHAGVFAEALEDADRCGMFSVPEDRVAFGCYPQGAAERIGHAWRLADALGTAQTLSAAHDAVLVSDDSPDMPLRTSDLFIASIIDVQGRPAAEVVDAWLAGAAPAEFAATPLDALTARYGLPSRPSAAQLEAELETGRAELERREQAVGGLARLGASLLTDNYERVARANPRWSWRGLNELQPLEAPERHAELTAVVAALRAQAESDGHLPMLLRLKARLDVANAAWWEASTRVAAVERAQLILRQVAFAHAPTAEVTDPQRARFARLRACEAAPLGTPAARTDAVAVAPPRTSPLTAPLRQDGFSLWAIGADGTVFSVPAESAAGKAGIRRGDRLIGAPADSGPWLVAAMSLSPADRPLAVAFERSGERIQVVLPAQAP